jgi:hypothetical protein
MCATKQRLNTAPHFLYHYEKKETKTALCAAIGRSREPEKKHTSTVRPVKINPPSVGWHQDSG